MVKVTGGEVRGHILYVPRGLEIRPTAGRVRESLFNIINEYITEADILDLFAGIGLLGIESLSRGARRATFVDKSKISLRYLRRNLEKTKLSNKSEIIKDDIIKALENLKNKKEVYDLIFLDPPYNINDKYIKKTLSECSNVLKKGGRVILEHFSKNKFEVEALRIERVKRYGGTSLSFYEIMG